MVALVLAILALALLPPAGLARDTQAPTGAGSRWLPAEDWVMFHWLPYDQRQLDRKLGLRHSDVLAWIRDDRHHTLAQLARARGRDPGRLAHQLVDAWARDATPGRHRLLVSRALRTLTQGHLSQHVLFHYFHQPALAYRARSTFGMSPLHYQWLRLQGRSPAALAAAHRRSRAQLAHATMRTLRRYALLGARRGMTPYPQARLWLGQERRHLAHWLDSRIRKPGVGGHGFHPARGLSGWKLMCELFRGHQSGVART